ncbi:hypothetical protein WA026_011390 [Henosepilachna vigintioctopunctata]|uniref:OCEL domain-containing protein n=1 Tax=Henosepilachna vigintioctopunctata TaxID=420089 RepID=A0AAW1TJH4_9CUCU
MSSTQDMEGPGGSFEGLRHAGQTRGPLEMLGSIKYKMRIHANDDVYAATKQRMTVAEENHKNKCTREIKPNQTDIGRKVKVKQNANVGRGSIPQIPPRGGSTVEKPPVQPHPSMRDSLLKPSSYPPSNAPSKQPSGVVNSNSNGMHHITNGLGSNHVTSTRPPNKPITPDILKRPLKERLIHLLALRPFKKYEIFERLTKEGLRERGSMSSVLKQVAFMKDNAFHLNRACWNDVRENWPFYTESEKQILKRRKPQNLTPPGSSDSGSSGSGQSPTSTHPGSPPPPITNSTKRPGYYDGADGFPTKRQRVSHYKKPTEPTANPPPAENKSIRRPVTDSRDSSNMNPRSRESPSITTTTPSSNNQGLTNGHHFANGYSNSTRKEKRAHASDDEMDEVCSKKRMCDNYNGGTAFDVEREAVDCGPYTNGYDAKQREDVDFPQLEKVSDDVRKEAPYQNGEAYPSERWANNVPDAKRVREVREAKKYENNKYDRDVTSSTVNGIDRVSPDSQSQPLTPPEPSPIKNDIPSPYPDYITEYTPIKNYEQRKRYKSDFNDNYAEYKDLHGIVEKVSRRFAELEERLKQEDMKSPRYKDIKKQIMKEYKENKKNLGHQKAKERFQYLHDKLSHIKELVKEYDKSIVDHQYQNDQY